MRQDNNLTPINPEIEKNEGDQINFQVGMTLRDLEKEAIMKTLTMLDSQQRN